MFRGGALVLIMSCAGMRAEDEWAPIRVLEGRWEGTAKGEPGVGTSSREYKWELRSRYLTGRSRTEYAPKTPGGKAEVHEEMGVFSYDRGLKKIVARQFHVEGFVNEYVLERVSEDGKTLEFVTRAIENIPAGWTAREEYTVAGPDEVVERFSLRMPGKEWQVYSETRLKRVK